MDQGNAGSQTGVGEKDASMSTRDGVTLYADVYRPHADGRLPVLAVRTPYDKSGDMALTEKDYLPQRGCVVVVQETRGRFRSEGEFYLFISEARDDYDSIEWAACRPWSDGNVGTVGQSDLGLVQYLAAQERPPHLRATSPVSISATHFENTAYMRGVFELGWMLVYFTFMAGNTLDRKGLHEQQKECLDSYLSHPELPLLLLIKEVYRYMRLSNWGDRLKDASPYFDDFLEHTIDLWATSHVFKVGYRLRLEVSSSNFPRNDRNADTGHDSGGHGELRVVQQTIFTNTAIGHI